MKPLLPLLIIAFSGNAVTFLWYMYAVSQPGGTGDVLAFALFIPWFWVIVIVASIIILTIKRRFLFRNDTAPWTLLTLLFTTPFPALAVFYLTHPTPETWMSSMATSIVNGKIYKTEFWEKTSTNRRFAIKRF